MKFLCLGYYNEATFDHMSPTDLEALGNSCRPHDEELKKTGALRLVASLERRKMVTVRAQMGKLTVKDGPFTEAKEIVGSIFIIEAKDMDDAVRIASLHPAACMGEELGWAIEVRPIEFLAES